MRALIAGGDSRLGRALHAELTKRAHSVYLTTRRRGQPDSYYLDMLVPRLANWWGIRQDANVDVIYVVAAVTGVVQCEADSSTWRVNADAPAEIAREAREWVQHVIFVSSDAVERAPHTAYAKQKAYAELAVLAQGGGVLRPARIGSEEAYAEVAEVLRHMGEGKTRGVVRWP